MREAGPVLTRTPKEAAMRGAGQCPKCGCRRVVRDDIPTEKCGNFYARTIEMCVNCKAAWEPFEPAALLDRDDPTSSFTEPCNNCAFRPGSPEQRDKPRWAELMKDLGAGAAFYCHKGVPLDPKGEYGFAYPTDAAGKIVPAKMRLCRGYLKMLSAQIDRKWPAEKPADTAAQET